MALVRKSSLVDPEKLNTFLQEPDNTDLPRDKPRKLARHLVRAALLTDFQAVQLLAGKSRGFNVGRYRVLEQTSTGGVGNSYLCEDPRNHEQVTVQLLPELQAEDPWVVVRYYQEVRIASALNHPNIASRHEIEHDDPVHFLVMPYLDGSSLRRIVRKHGPMEVTRAVHYVRQAAAGLQHIHETGLVHSDIQPRHLVLDRQGTVKIVYLGMAAFFRKQHEATRDKAPPSDAGYDDNYAAPELAAPGGAIDIRTDIYGLGATFYYLLTRKPPFEKIADPRPVEPGARQPAPVRQLRPEVPEELAAVLDRMMALDPAQRYQTPAEVIEALAPWTQTSLAPPPAEEMPDLSPAALSCVLLEVEPGAPKPPTAVPPPEAAKNGEHPAEHASPGAEPIPQADEPLIVVREESKPAGRKEHDSPPARHKQATCSPAAVKKEELALNSASTDSRVELYLDPSFGETEAQLSLEDSTVDSAPELAVGDSTVDEEEPAQGLTIPLLPDPPDERSPAESSPKKRRSAVGVGSSPAVEPRPAISLLSRETPPPASLSSSGSTPLESPTEDSEPEPEDRERRKGNVPQILTTFSRPVSVSRSGEQPVGKKKRSGPPVNLGKGLVLVVLIIAAMLPICFSLQDLVRVMFSDPEERIVPEDQPQEEQEKKMDNRLEGALDAVGPEVVHGWAWDKNDPDNPVRVDIYDGVTLLATVLADIYRPDLHSQGLGNGRHVFGYQFPSMLRDNRDHRIHVKFSGTAIDLTGSPQIVAMKAP